MIPATELDRIAEKVARWHRSDREQGQATGRVARLERMQSLLGHLTAARDELNALLLDVEHAEMWPLVDYEADCEALRRLQHTAALKVAMTEREPSRRRKDALPMAALMLAQACEGTGTRPTLAMMRAVVEKAGLVLSDDALKKALAAEVKGNKSGRNRQT